MKPLARWWDHDGPPTPAETADFWYARCKDAERRIAAALACHTQVDVARYRAFCRCGALWLAPEGRCSSETVTALLPDTETPA